MKNGIDEIKLLEQFLVNNKELEILESRISEFNIFEALGAVKQELRHSDFLSFLMNPNENHGLHEIFLKRLLQKASMTSDRTNINAIEIDTADYSGVEIRREWNSIDILIIVPKIPIACAIENKIFSGEHLDQLKRYKDLIIKEFPDSKYLFMFLSPDGITPSDEDWLPLSYNDIAEILNNIAESTSSTLGSDIYTLIKHYTAMLERHIISDSQIAELCRKIYNTHKKAIDLIIEHRPDIQLDIKSYFEKIIKEVKEPGLITDHCSKSYIRFAPKEWEKLEFQKTGEGWTRTHRVLMFEIQNFQDSLTLKLIIGPGEPEARKKIFEAVQQNKKVFKGALNKLYDKFSQIYRYDIIKRKEYEDLTDSEIFAKIDEHWAKFIKEDLIRIIEIIKNINFNQ
ncbi:MAG: hypothetical protein KatS3mg002_1664 [Candidatus Woesearchaeota archaeon]|nr:MAG: hypothetical protein KatS3mg002_1664 [Candidatus Woesearchaeota archaeon]